MALPSFLMQVMTLLSQKKETKVMTSTIVF